MGFSIKDDQKEGRGRGHPNAPNADKRGCELALWMSVVNFHSCTGSYFSTACALSTNFSQTVDSLYYSRSN